MNLYNTNKRRSLQKQLCIIPQRNLSQDSLVQQKIRKWRHQKVNPEQIIRFHYSLQQLRHQHILLGVHAKKKSFYQFVNTNQASVNTFKKKHNSRGSSLIISFDNKISPIHMKSNIQKRQYASQNKNQTSVDKNQVSKSKIQRIGKYYIKQKSQTKPVNEWVNQFKQSLRIRYIKKPLLPKQIRIKTQGNEPKILFDCRPWTRRQKQDQQQNNISNRGIHK